MTTISATRCEELGKHHIAREHTLLLDALPAPRIGKCANGKSCADDLIETRHCKVRESSLHYDLLRLNLGLICFLGGPEDVTWMGRAKTLGLNS